MSPECRKCRQLVSAYLDGETTRNEERFIREHTQTCQECQEALQAYQGIRAQFQTLPQPIPPTALRRSVLTAVRTGTTPVRYNGRRSAVRNESFLGFSLRWGVALATAAALLVIAIAVFLAVLVAPTKNFQVSYVYPDPQKTALPIGSSIVVNFNQPLDKSQLPTIVSDPPNAIQGQPEVSADGKSIIIHTDQQAAASGTLSVTISGLKDTSNQPVAGDKVQLKYNVAPPTPLPTTNPAPINPTATPAPRTTTVAPVNTTTAPVQTTTNPPLTPSPTPLPPKTTPVPVKSPTTAPPTVSTTVPPVDTATAVPPTTTPPTTVTATVVATTTVAVTTTPDTTPTITTTETVTVVATTPLATTTVPVTTTATTPTVPATPSPTVSATTPTPATTTPTLPATTAAAGFSPPPTHGVNPQACNIPPVGGFGLVYTSTNGVATKIGCPTEHERQTTVAYRAFEHGFMFYEKDQDLFWVFFNDNDTWQFFKGNLESYPPPPPLTPPSGLYEPDSGFGRLWYDEAGFQKRLGWSIQAYERSSTYGAIQHYDNGLMLDNPDKPTDGHAGALDVSGTKRVYVLFNDGTFINSQDNYPD